jgi:hypothetical protein
LSTNFLDWQFPNLLQVLGGYLHQDFDLDYESPDAALRAATENQGHDPITGALREIDRLLASEIGDDELMQLIERLTAGFSPSLAGWTAREWLRHTRELLSSASA